MSARRDAAVRAVLDELQEIARGAAVRMVGGSLSFAGIDGETFAARILSAGVVAAAPAGVVTLLREEEGHVCTCGSDAVCKGCSEGFEDRCRFEAVLRALLGEAEQAAREAEWICPVCGDRFAYGADTLEVVCTGASPGSHKPAYMKLTVKA